MPATAWLAALVVPSDTGGPFPPCRAGNPRAARGPATRSGVVPLAWLVADGFLENRLGELSRHGSTDLYLILQLVVAAALGLGPVRPATGCLATRRTDSMTDLWYVLLTVVLFGLVAVALRGVAKP